MRRNTVRLASILSVLIVGVATGACAKVAGVQTGTASPGAVPRPAPSGIGVLHIDWANPVHGSVVHGSTVSERLAAAQQQVPFTLHLPRGLGSPEEVLIGPAFVPPRDVAPGPTHVVAFIFQTPQFGEVVVSEGPPDVPPRQWTSMVLSMVAQNGSPMVTGTAERIVLSGGRIALLTTSATGHSFIEWLDGDTEYIVGGPDLTRSAALAIARSV